MELDMPIPKGRGFTPFPFGQCQVCGAEATGNHYGANTCEGCKGFFKRSLPVFRTFRCFFGNKCEVTPETRNRCKACRFRKCVEAGMALDAVKMGRIPKAVKEHAMEGKGADHRVNRQISAGSHKSSASSSPGAASPVASVSSPGSPGDFNSNNHHGEGSFPVSRNRAASSSVVGAALSEFRGGLPEGRRYTMHSTSMSNGMLGGATGNGFGGGMSKPVQLSDTYRFNPYGRPEPQFKTDRGLTFAYPSVERVHDGGVLWRGGDDVTRKHGFATRSDWQPTSSSAASFYSSHVPVVDGTTTTAPTTTAIRYYEPPKSVCVTGQKPVVACSTGVSGGAVSFNGHDDCVQKIIGTSVISSYHPDLQPPTARMRAMADYSITGDFNENAPDLDGTDKIRTAMANRETAVAVMNPSLRGVSHDSMPVVPGDIFVFQPSYVPEEKIPEVSYGSQEITAKSKLNMKRRRLESFTSGGSGDRVTYKIPVTPTLEYFGQVAVNPDLKSAMCSNTFRTVAEQNNTIYGDETRANEEFLKKAVGTGAPTAVEHTGQQMRDILKDRLITQVKRVVQLSESVPGFRSLNVKDQHTLLRTCILDVWMVHSARFLRDGQSYILFLETKTHYSRHWMQQFLTDEFLETVFKIATGINSLDLNFDELALLKSILIVRPDRPGLENVEFITALHNHLLDSLKVAIATRRPVESIQLLDDLLELLKGWSILDLMQEKYVHPIDLSQMCQGPWKIGGSTGTVAAKNAEADGTATQTSASVAAAKLAFGANPSQNCVLLRT